MDGSGTLVVIGIAAFILPALAGWIRVPAVVLEILFGVIVGPVLGLVHGTELLDQIAELGLLMLMFLAGFEIDFAALRRGGAGPILQALAVFCGTLALSFLATAWLDLALFYAPVLATNFGGAGAPEPPQRRDHFPQPRSGDPGRRRDRRPRDPAAGGRDHHLGARRVGRRADRRAGAAGGGGAGAAGDEADPLVAPEKGGAPHSGGTIPRNGIRGALALLAVFVGLSAALDVEPLLAAFLAGGVFALLFQPPEGLRSQLSGISRGFLIPVFFINVGLRFEVARSLIARCWRGPGSSSAWRSSSSSSRRSCTCSGLFAARGGGRRIAAVGPAQPRGGGGDGGARTGPPHRRGPHHRGPDRRRHLDHLPRPLPPRHHFRQRLETEDGVGASAPATR